MKEKILFFSARRLVFISGLVVCLVALEQHTLYGAFMLLATITCTLVLALFAKDILKMFFRKQRPGENKSVEGRYAFPSGHATGLAVLTVAVFHYHYGYGLVLLCLTLLVVYARVRTKVHDVADIIAGLLLGGCIAYFSLPYAELFVETLFHNL